METLHRLQTTTTNLTAHTVHASLAEALCTLRHRLDNKDVRHIIDKLACALTEHLDIHQKTIVFNEWWHYSRNNIAALYPQMQLFLKGLASETLSITVPFPVTRQQLHEIIAKKTLVTSQNLSLDSMHHHVDAQNADLFYIENNMTLELLLLLNGGSDTPHPSNSGPRGPRKHAKPPTHPQMKFHIYVNGPDQYHNVIRALPSDKISHLKEILDPRVDLRPSFQTLYLQEEQLDDDLILHDFDLLAGTTLQLLRTTPPSLCQLHDKNRHPDHLRQKLDPSSQKWMWVCHTNSACIIERHTQANARATTNAITPHPMTSRAPSTAHRSTYGPRNPAAANTPPGPHLLDTSTSLSSETRVYAHFSDGVEYPATIQGNYTGGNIVIFDIEENAPYHITNDRFRPLHPPPAPTVSDPPSPECVVCGLHNRSRSISNLKWQAHPTTNDMQWICKSGKECATRAPRQNDSEQHSQPTRQVTAISHNFEAGTDDTSSTSSWDETDRRIHELSVSAKMTVNPKVQQRGITSLETRASSVLRTTTQKPARTTRSSSPVPASKTCSRQGASPNSDDFPTGMDDTRLVTPHQKEASHERYSLQTLSLVQTGNSDHLATPKASRPKGTQQPSPPSQNFTALQPVAHGMPTAPAQPAAVPASEQDEVSHLTLPQMDQEPLELPAPQETAPAPPQPITETHNTTFFVHGAGHTLTFHHSLDFSTARLKHEIQSRTDIPASEQILSFKGTELEDARTLQEYDLQQYIIIDLTIRVRAAATPSSAPHLPHPPVAPITAVPPLSATSTARTVTWAPLDDTSPPADAANHSNDTSPPADAANHSADAVRHPVPEQTTTLISFGDRTLDEHSSALLQPEISEVIAALAQLPTMASQGAPMSQQQVMITALEQDDASHLTIPQTTPQSDLTPSSAATTPNSAPPNLPLTSTSTAPPSDTIQFFVKDSEGKSITMRAALTSTGGHLKARLVQRIHIPSTQQRLIYRAEIQDSDTLQGIMLQPNGTIHLMLNLFGGMERDTPNDTAPTTAQI